MLENAGDSLEEMSFMNFFCLSFEISATVDLGTPNISPTKRWGKSFSRAFKISSFFQAFVQFFPASIPPQAAPLQLAM